ncbi:MAG: 3-oxoacyl-[acyl-carrier-protein] reductase FabG [Planctomycetes bacterium]|nr:3-oxoacyl-[acyl-carrier-protein] reductase FabG [Planctomycetota bacterium]
MADAAAGRNGPCTALVTGASRGIGRAVALRLAGDGFRIAAAARDVDRLEAVVAEIRAAGGSAEAVRMDVADEASVRAGVARAASLLGAPRVVVNNAGVATAVPFADLTAEQWAQTFAVNVTGPFLVTRECLPAMVAAGWGRVVSVGSTASLQGYPRTAHYVASKHALLGMTRALALEVATRGVTVNCVCPGYVDTELTATSIERMAATTGKTREEVRRMIESASPQRRLIAPDEVAAAVAWLCTDAARGVNGQAVAVNGG